MGRLTKRVEAGEAVYYLYGFGAFDEVEALAECVDRLAAYEDTGITPEYIASALKTLDMFADATKGVPLNRIRELVEAEKDGRLVVLDEPRKPLVWGEDTHDTILCPNCNHDLMGGFPEDEYCGKDMYQCPYCGQPIDSGKAMTREEAEAALKKMDKEADNAAD